MAIDDEEIVIHTLVTSKDGWVLPRRNRSSPYYTANAICSLASVVLPRTPLPALEDHEVV